MSELTGQPCPMCRGKTLTLREGKTEVPYFGEVLVFSMTCTKCKYHISDVELAKKQEPVKYVFEIASKDDLKVRVVKSGAATVKVQYVGSIEPGPAAQGYVTNVEGVINRIKRQVENIKEHSDDPTIKKKAKNLLKKIQKILWGKKKAKLTIEDPTGNSAIISEKAVKTKLK